MQTTTSMEASEAVVSVLSLPTFTSVSVLNDGSTWREGFVAEV